MIPYKGAEVGEAVKIIATDGEVYGVFAGREGNILRVRVSGVVLLLPRTTPIRREATAPGEPRLFWTATPGPLARLARAT